MEKTTTKTKTILSEVSSPILSELVKIVFMAISNPLYFSYFIFFSPYIFKLFSFLSPLFVTTTLLVLALVTTATTTKLSLITTSKVNEEDEDRCFEDSEVYRLVFDTAASLEAKQQPEDVVVIKETCSEDHHEPVLDKLCLIVQERSLVRSSDKVVAKVNDERSGWDDDLDSAVKSSPSPSSHVDDIEIDGGDYSTSMRKENKEWRRTLACKLFEERHNGAGEGMDLLWETYEAEQSNDKSQAVKNDNNIIKKMRRNSTKRSSSSSGISVISSISSSKGIIMNNNNSDDIDDDDYEDETNGQLCCLQALKFSAGKMSLGMGKPSLVKFSKAFKGFGWLQNVARHGKKRYNNNNNNTNNRD